MIFCPTLQTSPLFVKRNTYDIIPSCDGLFQLGRLSFLPFLGELDVSPDRVSVRVRAVLPALAQTGLVLLPRSQQIIVNDLKILVVGEHIVRWHDGDEKLALLGLYQQSVTDVDAQTVTDRTDRSHQLSLKRCGIVDYIVVGMSDPRLQ